MWRANSWQRACASLKLKIWHILVHSCVCSSGICLERKIDSCSRGWAFISNHMPDKNTNDNTAQPIYRLSMPMIPEKFCPGWVSLWTEWQRKFMFAMCFLLLVLQCGELILDKGRVHLWNYVHSCVYSYLTMHFFKHEENNWNIVMTSDQEHYYIDFQSLTAKCINFVANS